MRGDSRRQLFRWTTLRAWGRRRKHTEREHFVIGIQSVLLGVQEKIVVQVYERGSYLLAIVEEVGVWGIMLMGRAFCVEVNVERGMRRSIRV